MTLSFAKVRFYSFQWRITWCEYELPTEEGGGSPSENRKNFEPVLVFCFEGRRTMFIKGRTNIKKIIQLQYECTLHTLWYCTTPVQTLILNPDRLY